MSQGVADSASFLEARLARCRAIPEHERSPEVAAFVLCADLQAQAAAALAARPARSLQTRRQEAVLFSLKVTASHCCPPGDSLLVYSEEVLRAAADQLHALLDRGVGGSNHTLPRQLGAVLEQDRSLTTLLTVAAGLPVDRHVGLAAELLPVVNGLVSRLLEPLETARVRQELAAAQAQLPAPLLSYEQLLALFVGYARKQSMAVITASSPGCNSGEGSAVIEAIRATADLLPRLVPQHHPSQFLAAMCASRHKGWNNPALELPLLRQVMRAAEQEGSAYTVALCGYQLPLTAYVWVHFEGADGPKECNPSEVLGWVRQAREARRRCEALLPQQWTCGLARRHKTAKDLKPWLQQLQQEGDRWRPMDASAKRVFDNVIDAVMPQLLHRPGAALECSGCGECAPHLKRCAACRLTQYCSPKCQHAHWPQHRAACKAEQRRQQQQRQ